MRQIGRGIVGEENLRPLLAKNLIEHAVGAVAPAGFGEGSVENDTVSIGGGVFLQKEFGGALRPHSVGAGRTFADFIDITD